MLKNTDIAFEKIFFKYETTKDLTVKDINISINGGTTAAFVGHSGAGKSTIGELIYNSEIANDFYERKFYGHTNYKLIPPMNAMAGSVGWAPSDIL